MMRNIMLLSAVVLLCSCSDFLKESSQDEVIVKTVADYSELLLGSGYPQPAISIPYSVLYLVDDDVEINEARVTATVNANITNRFGYFTWQPDMWERVGATLGKGYDQTYERIMGCNAVLDYIDEAIGGQEERDKTKAEALAVRAMLYFQLVNMFGEPYNENKAADGVVLKLTSGLEEGGMKRASVADVYDQILSDLQNSEKLFLKYKTTRGSYRINLTSVYILLSRVYLYMEQWDDAVNAATKSIKASTGLTDYTQLSTPFYLTTYDLSEVELLYGGGSFDLSNGMPTTAFSPSSELISLYSTNDMRLTFWFATDKKSVTKKASSSVRPTSTIRISEAYLNRAEAIVRGGSASNQALSDLNELRRNRIKEYTDVTITDNSRLLEEILIERRLELCFDMHRWFDLRRNGMPQIEHLYRDVLGAGNPWVKYTLKERDPLYTLPIPNLMIEHNIMLNQNASAYGPERAGTDIN